MSIKDDYERIKGEVEREDREIVRVALFGQPGAGKSSLINTIVGAKVAHVSQKTDATTEAQIVEYKGLLFVDLPGYGTSKFPANQWVTKFQPEQYDLFLCVFKGKMHDDDTRFFRGLAKDRVCLFVRTYADSLWEDEKTIDELKKVLIDDTRKHTEKSDVKVHFVSNRTLEGIVELEQAIQNSLEPAKRDRFVRSFKARTEDHLNEKRKICDRLVGQYSAMAAVNALNPIPGTDIAIDIALLTNLFSEIRKTYGLDDKESFSAYLGVPLAQKILDQATQEGIMLLLRKFAASGIGKNVMKYIPFIGQAIAAMIGFAVTSAAGNSYLNDCHELAVEIMRKVVDSEKEA